VISAGVAARVQPFIEDIRTDPVFREVVAIAVTGSAARSEEVWDGNELCSDIDLMVVTRSSGIRAARMVDAVIGRHHDRGIEGGRIPIRALERYRTLAFYEAKCNGVVLTGARSVFDRVPVRDACELPPWEAVRVAANRLFEHVKLTLGRTTASTAVRKTYEALSEAALVLEGRYRPSYRDRLEEIARRDIPALVPDLRDKAVEAAQARLEGRAMRGIEVADARADLLAGVRAVLTRYTGIDADPTVQLDHVARDERHLRHRSFWAAYLLVHRRPGLSPFRRDPILSLWSAALAAVRTERAAPVLLDDWHQCPQILKTKEDHCEAPALLR
jgi:hypothetical protein